jgi:hypothetical protein
MRLDNVTIDYGTADVPIQLQQIDEFMLRISRGRNFIELIPDELIEIVQIAKLLNCEGFDGR